MRVLIIGCGNIGALYDFNSDSILTHAKAFSRINGVRLSFFDLDFDLAKLISEKYNADYLTEINEVTFSNYDCICICTPTNTHFDFLIKAFKSNVKLVICEKPISLSQTELSLLKDLYCKSQTKILVNYIRRFQPDYLWLKSFVEKLLIDEYLTNISIRYQRGFINNCSHALDIISFITSTDFILKSFQKNNIIFDQFENDPTMSILGNWNETNLSVLGLSNVEFSHFEIDLYFKTYRIEISQSGNIINIYKADVKGRSLNSLNKDEQLSRSGCLKNYMEHVISKAIYLFNDSSQKDNFLESVDLNLSMLKILN